MKIDTVYISTHRYDTRFTKICVASVRYWYPDIPICLIVDYSNGNLPLKSFCRKWRVDILKTSIKQFGWGFGKLEPLFSGKNERFLVLDSDTVLTGPVLDKIKHLNAHLIVDEETQSWEKLTTLYYEPDPIEKLLPGFHYPGYTFNTGQWIGVSGALARADFANWLVWKERPELKYPAYLKNGDQGVFNLVVHIKEKEGQIRVERIPLMIWPEQGMADFIELNSLRHKSNAFPFIIHWAGIKKTRLEDYPRSDILKYYEAFFYSRYNSLTKYIDIVSYLYLKYEKKFRYRLTMLRRKK